MELLEELGDTLGEQDVRTSGHQDIRTSGHQDIRTQGLVVNCHLGLKLLTCLTFFRELLGKYKNSIIKMLQ